MKKAYFPKAGARLEIDANLLGPCGFYCGSCSAYKKGDCFGCRYQADRTCDILVCAAEKGFSVCADCPKHLCDKFDFLKKMRKKKPSPQKSLYDEMSRNA
jgi:hypothetical protein